MAKLSTFSFLFLFILVFSGIAENQNTPDVSLSKIINETGAFFTWDPFLELGELTLNGKSVRFKIGVPFIILNYSKKVEPVEVTRGSKGAIFFSLNGEKAIQSLFKKEEQASGGMKVKAIIIDPGHGGKDPGAIGRHTYNGKLVILKEKDVVLTVAKRLYALLIKQYPDKTIILTRDTDRYITLEGRTNIANSIKLKENEAMIFVSIHANASLNSHSKGFEIWYLPTNYRRKLVDPKSLDNDLKDVAPILNSMLEEEFTVESVLLAQQIEAGLKGVVGKEIEDRGLKEESWFVVRNAKMPAVLMELGFVTNKDEARILKNPVYLKKMSEGIYNGIHNFIDHFDTSQSE